MLQRIDKLAKPGNVQYTSPAVLTRLAGSGEDNKLLVRIEHEQTSFLIEAKNALLDYYSPQVGDELLVSGENFRCCYIIGVLQTSQPQPSVKTSDDTVSTAQGALARRHLKNGHETLSVEDDQGHLLFEYDATENKSRLYAAQGDLSLTALQGDIELISGKNIHCKSLGGLTMESATAAQLRVASEAESSAISLTDKGLLMTSNQVGLRAKSGNIKIEHCQYEGDTFKAVLDRSKILVGKIETVAIRIIERAKNVYRHVEELQQTRANRVRTLVEGSYQLNSETSYIKAKKNVNIDGEKIHLG